MKNYKYTGAVVAVLLLAVTLTFMSVDDLIDLGRLEPVDANNILAIQYSIIYVLIKTLLLSYGTFLVCLELYDCITVVPKGKGKNQVDSYMEHLVKETAKVKAVNCISSDGNDKSKCNEWSEPCTCASIISDVASEPDISKLEFDRLGVEEYMRSKPVKDLFINDKQYYDALDMWLNSLPANIASSWRYLHNYFEGRSTKQILGLPDNIKLLLDLGYTVD